MAATTWNLRISDITWDSDSPIRYGIESISAIRHSARRDGNWDYEDRWVAEAQARNTVALDSLTGHCFYVVETSPQRQDAHYALQLRLPRTNQGVERASGWLGTTDNIYREAHGAWRVVGRSRTHLHLVAVEETPASFPRTPYMVEQDRIAAEVQRESDREFAAQQAQWAREEAVAQ